MDVSSKSITKPPFYRVFLLAFTIVIMQACSDKTAQSPRKDKPHIVQTAPPEWKVVPLKYTSIANVLPAREIKISNQLAGRIIKIHAYPGDSVRKGERLITMDASLLKAELDKATAELKQAQTNISRLKDLARKKLSSEDEISKAYTSLDIAKANLERLQLQYNYRHIVANFTGRISEKKANEGDIVALHSHLLTLMDTQHLKIQPAISASFIPLLKIHDKVEVKCPQQTLHAPVTRIYPAIDPQSQQGTIEVEWQAENQSVIPGQLCQLQIQVENNTRLMIPNTAIQYDTNGAYVFLNDKNKARKQYIKLGIQLDNASEVKKGIKENDSIIIAGLLNLSNGDTIKSGSTL